ncbi:MAG: methyltransferase domain-containing protein [Bacteriovoracaceae bacterium]|nr:methyltransferase domain-containing protein [Bacteriovoracaceae bacterium]
MNEVKRYFDASQGRLLYIGSEATNEYWDEHWATDKFEKALKTKSYFVSRVTKRHLPAGSRILEGGCGQGDKVYTLKQMGYESVGLDFAEATVDQIKAVAPELEIVLGDVRELPFSDDEFDGYWSIGVIEHFYEGYGPILSEMARVIKPGGKLFLTFPAMSRFRRLKSFFNFYNKFEAQESSPKGFYQFALNVDKTTDDLRALGFTVVEEKYFDGLKGFKDELPLIKPLVQKLYDSRNFFARAVKAVFNIIFSWMFGHSVLLVCKK